MRQLFIYIILFLFINIVTICQDNFTTKVNITTNLDSSLIFLNDEFIAKGECTLVLEKGDYNFIIMKSDKQWGSEIIKDSLRILSCTEDIDINYTFEKKTVVRSQPWSTVVAKDSVIGHTPISLKMSLGNIQLRSNGYEAKRIELKNVSVQPKTKLNFIGMKEQETFFETTLFKVLIGSAVALGATAAYFKLKADDNFDKYNETRKSEYLDNTDRYDLYSGIAFGALQLNFGALLYYFLIE